MKFFTKIKNAFTADNWETIYASSCACSYGSLFYGSGKTEAVVLIQVERDKNKHRGVIKALAQEQNMDIAEICVDNPKAQEACKKEGIIW